jgi:HlyD family secretion protein
MLAVLAAGAGGVVALVPGVGKSFRSLYASERSQIAEFVVKPIKLSVIVGPRGSLESSNSQIVYCRVEGQATILTIVPEGTRVKKGEIVCTLDSSTLEDNLKNQIISTSQAEAALKNASLSREVAEIAIQEYEKGLFEQDMMTYETDVMKARANLDRANDRLKWTRDMFNKNYSSKAQLSSEEQTQSSAQIDYDKAVKAREVFLKFSKARNLKELYSEREKALSDELSKKQTYELELIKQKKLERQIANCKLTAPNDGIVVYANDPGRMGMSQQPQIEEGATVREQQKIFSLPDISHMQVNTKVHESEIDRIAKGMKAKIRVDAFANQELTGTVESVQPLPDPTSFMSSDVKVYTTIVTIDNPLPGLRPGMTAKVDILVSEQDDVLAVPLQAILAFKGTSNVYVKTPKGPELRKVVLGTSNDQFVEVKEGLKDGDIVALNPGSLMTDAEKREAFGPSTKSSGGSWGKGAGGGPGGPAGKGAGGFGKGAGGKGAGKGARKGKGQFGGDPALREKLKNMSPDEKRQFFEQLKSQNPGGFGGGFPGGGQGS